MYTDAMRVAFRSVRAPQGFAVRIEDNDNFITVRASEKMFMSLTDEDKRSAVEYLARVKMALEENGAIVLIVREGGKEE